MTTLYIIVGIVVFIAYISYLDANSEPKQLEPGPGCDECDDGYLHIYRCGTDGCGFYHEETGDATCAIPYYGGCGNDNEFVRSDVCDRCGS